MSIKNTTRQWQSDKGKQVEFRCIGTPIWGNDGNLIGCCFGSKDDADLMAAAPDLLDALQCFVITRSVAKSLSKAYAAIDKATGKSSPPVNDVVKLQRAGSFGGAA